MKTTAPNRVRFAEILNMAIYDAPAVDGKASLLEIWPILDEYCAAVEASPARSAWARGVKEYAIELLEKFGEWLECASEYGETLPELSTKTLLNGAASWSQYSFGGGSLIYNEGIAERLCTPSELRKCRGGLRNLGGVEWLDHQARALQQAATLIMTISK